MVVNGAHNLVLPDHLAAHRPAGANMKHHRAAEMRLVGRRDLGLGIDDAALLQEQLLVLVGRAV